MNIEFTNFENFGDKHLLISFSESFTEFGGGSFNNIITLIIDFWVLFVFSNQRRWISKIFYFLGFYFSELILIPLFLLRNLQINVADLW